MENIKLIIKGFFMGIANIIPGVSGGTLAITMGIYEKLINTITHFFSNIKENILFILKLGIGMLIAVILGSKIISYSLDYYTFPTLLFFTGLIVGGLPLLYNKIKSNINFKNIFIMIITFTFVIGLTFLKETNNVNLDVISFTSIIKLFIVGVVAAATMIIPGISGSFMLMVMGYYEPVLNVINEFTSLNNILHNFVILAAFGSGILVGIVGIAKILEILFKKYEKETYFGVIGFVLASTIGIFKETEFTINFGYILVGIILFLLGFIIAYKLGDK